MPKKLGLGPGKRLRIVGADPAVVEGLTEYLCDRDEPYDVIMVFATHQSTLTSMIAVEIPRLVKDGGLWLCWPKMASKVDTDITENALREIVLPMGLVDNKVCAVTDVWSGLRFVWRKENR